MIKTLTIDGQDIRFKSTALTPIVYKSQFNSDFLVDVIKILPMAQSMQKSFKGLNVDNDDNDDGDDNENMDLDGIDFDSLNNFDTTVFTSFMWAFAKTADKTIPEPFEWYYKFDDFPIMDYLPDIIELMVGSFSNSKQADNVKKKNHPAVTTNH